MSLLVISYDQVHGILKSMNIRKASGPDGIPPRVLRECGSRILYSNRYIMVGVLIVVFLGVLFFLLLFINNHLSCTSNSIYSYADDSTLHSSTHFKSVPSFPSRVASRLQLSDSILSDLDEISRLGHRNYVKFNFFTSLSQKHLPTFLSLPWLSCEHKYSWSEHKQ